jgi:hypothetical protein
MHFTTNSPQKHHAEHRVFLKTPCKNACPPRQEKRQQNHANCPRFYPGEQFELIAID